MEASISLVSLLNLPPVGSAANSKKFSIYLLMKTRDRANLELIPTDSGNIALISRYVIEFDQSAPVRAIKRRANRKNFNVQLLALGA